jgi:GNAT superfamily N-acetyltransferase
MGKIKIVKSSHGSSEINDSLGLIMESFGDVDVAHREYYQWQYLQNPLGVGTVILAYDGNIPVGQFASIPSLYFINGVLTRSSLTMNLAVSPKYRGQGIMLRLLEEIRNVEPSVPFSVGVPNDQSLRGHLKNGFKPLQMKFLVRPIRLSRYFYGTKRSLLKPLDILWKKTGKDRVQELVVPFDDRFENLSNAIYQKIAIRQVRNAAILNWRYISNPRRNYLKLIVTGQTGTLEGYAIVRVAELMGKEVGIILDFVFNDQNSGESLILKMLEYFWEKQVALAIYTHVQKESESSLLRKYGFFGIPKRFYPHPLSLCLKILDHSYEHEVELLDSNNWIFRFGDYETF